jgi:hypothetical protein
MKKLLLSLMALMLALQAKAQYEEPPYYFKGMLNGKIEVEIAFEIGPHGITAGYIYYPKAKTPAPILIVGSYMPDDDPYNMVYLREFQADGTVTGILQLRYSEVEGDYEFVSGQWTNPKTLKDMPFSRMASQFRKPAWYPSSPLTPEDPGNIGREYSYTFWNSNYKAMMGGNITFRAAAKNKLHFAATNCPQNIAEGDSDPDRPAVLKGNEFEYSNVNECHYGFRATFFPLFVVLETTEGTDELHKCFGLGATFDGIYIKQKQ